RGTPRRRRRGRLPSCLRDRRRRDSHTTSRTAAPASTPGRRSRYTRASRAGLLDREQRAIASEPLESSDDAGAEGRVLRVALLVGPLVRNQLERLERALRERVAPLWAELERVDAIRDRSAPPLEVLDA